MRKDLNLLKGAIDLHVHSAPDLFNRSLDHIELAEQAREAHLRAVVLKCHFSMTPFRAYLAKKVVGGEVDIFGGIVLNQFVGGLNPFAVDVAIKAGAKIVWMPTISSKNHLRYYGGQVYNAQKMTKGMLKPLKEGISPLDRRGELLPEAKEILDMVAEADIILATGHLSAKESEILVREAKEIGVKKILINHPEFEVVNMSMEDQKKMAKMGAYLEHTFLQLTPMWHTLSPDAFAEIIGKVGTEHSILATDLGQIHNPPPVEGMRVFIQILLEKGMNPQDIEIMVKKNPAKLLNLESS